MGSERNKNEFEWSKEKSEISLCFLTWQDCLERLDTLLLESRHLQENIIYSLGQPEMYCLLAYEEEYIWKTKYYDAKFFDVNAWATSKAKEGIPQFPNPSDNRDEYNAALKAVDEYENGDLAGERETSVEYIQKKIETRVRERWVHNRWSQDDRRHYHLLRATQILKRNIFYDKLYLNVIAGLKTGQNGRFKSRPLRV